MAKKIPTVSISSYQTIEYLAKAKQFLEAAEFMNDMEMYAPSVSQSCHACISAADAVCGAYLSKRSTAADHNQVRDILKGLRPHGKDIISSLSRALRIKPLAEYESAPMTQKDATRALGWARKCVSIASDAVSQKVGDYND